MGAVSEAWKDEPQPPREHLTEFKFGWKEKKKKKSVASIGKGRPILMAVHVK